MSTWMVVEDEPDIYEVLLAMFEMWGIDGLAFVDGEEAINWIEEVDQKRFDGFLPELAILDIRLPGRITGTMVGERLRKSAIMKDVAIVMTTAFNLTPEEEKQVLEQSGADKLIYKPLPRFSELRDMLEEIVEKYRARRQAKASSVMASEQKDGDDIAFDSITQELERDQLLQPPTAVTVVQDPPSVKDNAKPSPSTKKPDLPDDNVKSSSSTSTSTTLHSD